MENHGEESKHDLKTAIAFTGFIFIAEVLGGLFTNSLALLSDAAHVFSDVFALSLSYLALKLAERPPSLSRTFGYHRAEVFAALANGVLLFMISLGIFYKAYQRISSPPEIKGMEMLVVAVVGLLVNLFVVFKLHGHAEHDLNVKSAFFHALGDAIASVGVITGALVIIFTGYTKADAFISIFIALIIVIGSLRLMRESQHILLEGTPRHIDLVEVRGDLNEVKGVRHVHDLHVWSVCSHINAATAHILVDDISLSETDEISSRVKDRLARFGINHATLQFECETVCECENGICPVEGHGGGREVDHDGH
jgi:cobalt-zinc-cadmium efflux system protein